MTYTWRFKSIRFNGLPTSHTPDSEKFDVVFKSKEKFDRWHKERTIGLAELDQSMNFCKYFVRDKGNEGHYVREGKSFPVDGSWVGIQDFDSNYPPTQSFVRWLEENGWRDNWFELRESYVKQLEELEINKL